MSLVMHLFKKDLRRLRTFLFFWLPVVLIAGIANCIQASGDDFAMQTALKVVTALSIICQFIMMAMMVPLLMHSEPLTGTTAFWLTRPLKKSDVMKSKLIFSGLIFILVPALINVVLLAVNQVPFSYLLPSVLEYILSYAGGLLLLMAIATLTRSFGFFALTGCVYLVIGTILGVVVAITTQFQEVEGGAASMVVTDSRTLISELVAILLLATIIYIQYRTRKTVWSYGILLLEFLITFYIGIFSNWAVFKEPANHLTTEESENIMIEVGERNSHISDSFSMRRRKISYKEVQGEFRFKNLPENSFAKANEIDAAFEAAGQKVSNETQHGSIDDSFVDQNTLRGLLEPLNLIQSRNYTSYSDKMLKISESDYLALRNETGKYTANVTFNVFRYNQVATLPLKGDEKYKDGARRISIASILNETEGCTVIIRQQSINPLFKRNREPIMGSKYTFVLVNRKLSEAYLPERDNNYARLSNSETTLSIKTRFLRFTSTDKPGTPITEEWLDEAELLIVETEWLGKAQKYIEDENFSFGQSSNNYVESIPNTSAKDNRDKLAKVELPDNPTRDEVKTYIQKIHNISATQSKFSDRDPQVDMLLKVGSKHLDLLIESANGWRSNYELAAIKKLTAIEHKELVLTSLRKLPVLVTAVNKFGWQADARETLLDELKHNNDLPAQWVKAVASFQDPKTYPLLTDFLIQTRYRSRTYDAIKDLPGIELDEAVSEAWKVAKYDSWERLDMISTAINHGHKDAFIAAIMSLDDEIHASFKRKFRKIIVEHTGINTSAAELIVWLDASKDHLYFDSETRKFVGVEMFFEEVAETLAKIRLPENPTRDDIRKYIMQIDETTKRQDHYAKDDVQVDMLAKVGPKHLDLLLGMIEYNHFYDIHAIYKIATPEHKDLILTNLDQHQFLSTLVVKYGWQNEVKELLIHKFKNEEHLQPSWIDAVASLEDPSIYPDLIQYFIHNGNRHRTYYAIKDLPGIELEDAVEKAWDQAKKHDQIVLTLVMLPIALEYGHADALEFYAEGFDPDSEHVSAYWVDRTHEAICKHTSQSGNYEDFRIWYRANKDHIQFDAETMMFVAE